MIKYAKYFLPVAAIAAAVVAKAKSPNIIVIMADDLGIGDVSCYGSTTISTPNIDRLANEGVRFTNGYATSATSTPSRYAMLTGCYPWKNKYAKILSGDAPLIIPTDQPTLPRTLQDKGYYTGVIGKWHLGMGSGNVDWNKRVTPGANDVGFNYSCIIAATNDRVPTVYVRNEYVVGLKGEDPLRVSYIQNFDGEPTALTNPELLKMEWSHGHNNSIVNGIPRIGYMRGGISAQWVDEDMADFFVGEVKHFVDEHQDVPFFLYYALHEPHVPRAPHSRFVGKSGMGARGDAILEADWCVGELYAYLESKGMLENTIIIFSSDNGPVLDDGYKDGAVKLLGNHRPSGQLRGGKYSLFDAGTHVPLSIYWKGQIAPSVNDALISQLDFFASFAALTGARMVEGTDSQNLLNVMMGQSTQGRKDLVIEANGKLAYRSVDWAMIPPYKGVKINEAGNELGNSPEYVLYNLKSDPSQQHDLSKAEPQILEQMKTSFLAITKGYYKQNVEEIPLQ